MDLTALWTSQIMGFALVFARLGSIIVYMPAIGEQLVPMRHRLVFALVLTLALYPATPVGSLSIGSPLELLPLLLIEVLIGIWIREVCR